MCSAKWKCVLLSFLVIASVVAPAVAAVSAPHFADYDAELRRPDGRIDTKALAQRLKYLGVTKYYWLLWHAPTDWDDLKLFLPMAAQAHLDVWAYLVPPSEGPAGGYPASEPFKLDYLKWAEELARLSLQQTNLTGWVLDDFYANRKFFTPDYVRQMQIRSKSINPRLVFFPLMYFPEITPRFVDDYRETIDGAVVAYPQDNEEIVYARQILNGANSSMPGQLCIPPNSPTHEGDFVSAGIAARVISTNRVRVRFQEQDDFAGHTAGYHFKQLTLDDAVIWEQDVADHAKGWQDVDVPLTNHLQGKTNLVLAFRLFDRKGVSNFGVRWRVRNLRTEGLLITATLQQPESWQVNRNGPFEAGFGKAVQRSEPRFHIPFVVMTAASTEEFRLRHGDPATPQRIADWLRMSLQTWRDGQCDGVVTYCLDKRPESQSFPLAQILFREFGNVSVK
jgi:hypothetical protein